MAEKNIHQPKPPATATAAKNPATALFVFLFIVYNSSYPKGIKRCKSTSFSSEKPLSNNKYHTPFFEIVDFLLLLHKTYTIVRILGEYL